MIVSFLIKADYGHFSPQTAYSTLTHPLPPKTAVIGMLASIQGYKNAGEYEMLNDIKYSIIVKNITGKMTYIYNGIKSPLSGYESWGGYNIAKKGRKQFYREILIKPEYLVFVDFSNVQDTTISESIIEKIRKHESVFPLYMGINNFMLDLQFEEIYDSNQNSKFADEMEIDSFVVSDTNFVVEQECSYSKSRIPIAIKNGRIFCGYVDIISEISGRKIKAQKIKYNKVGEYNLVFI